MKRAETRQGNFSFFHPAPSRGVTALLARGLLRALLRRVRGAAFRVRYWDGLEETFGEGTPQCTVSVRDPGVVWALLRAVDLGLGEAYMDGRVEVDDLDAFLKEAMAATRVPALRLPRFFPRLDPNTVRREYRAVRYHYDLGDAFFALWLDESRTYSCAYFETPAATLEEAQRAKRRHILRKLQLAPGQSLLDIGCGWGALLFDAALEYGVRACGITLSKAQHAWVRRRIEERNLQGRVHVQIADYRELARSEAAPMAGPGGQYDRVVSVGMFEHVGRRHLRDYMQAVARLLKPGGLSLLHTITRPREQAVGPWISRYIFPGGYIPSWRETVWLLPDCSFELLDVENLRLHYALTLDHWSRRYEEHLTQVRALGYDERFIRMWRLYLRGSAAAFRYGDLSLHQFLFSRGRNNALPLTRAHLYAPETGAGSGA